MTIKLNWLQTKLDYTQSCYHFLLLDTQIATLIVSLIVNS